MININTNGLLIDTDFLMNYKKHNLSGEEALFLLQINYLTEPYFLKSRYHPYASRFKSCFLIFSSNLS